MLIALLIALVAVNIAYLLLIDRRDARDRDERAVLMQRALAPAAAAMEHHEKVAPTEEPVSPLPMTDEEMAALGDPHGTSEFARVIRRMEDEANGLGQIEDGIYP